MEPILYIIPVAIVVALAIRLAAGSMDHERIRQYLMERGSRVLEIRWDPFGPGWFGEKNDRIYHVRYVDREGNEHDSHCKTSLWTGVYFTEDRIARRAVASARTPAPETLEEENRRLREELARLKNQRAGE
jgi:hypothetical protein